MITASLKNTRIAPRKIRVVANMVRGKSVVEAKNILAFAAKKGRHPISDLIDSAVANASHNFKIGPEGLMVKEIRVDQGFVMKRSMPVSHGSAHPIALRTSHVSVVLAPGEGEVKKGKKQIRKEAKIKSTKK